MKTVHPAAPAGGVADDSGSQHAVRLRIKESSVLRAAAVSGSLAALSPVLVVTDKVSPDTIKALRHSPHSWVSRRPLPSGLRGEQRIGDRVVDHGRGTADPLVCEDPGGLIDRWMERPTADPERGNLLVLDGGPQDPGAEGPAESRGQGMGLGCDGRGPAGL